MAESLDSIILAVGIGTRIKSSGNNLATLWNQSGLVAGTGKSILISNGDNVCGQEFRELFTYLPPEILIVIS